MSEKKVRVRFAPSPTGALHIGGVRTALYNYLFAKQNGGDMILRIEDTDSNRFVPGAEEYIIESLEWLGIKFDEGVKYGGNFGPYRQSERRDIYKKYVKQLLDSGNAYIAFDTPEELDAKRNEIANFQYDASTRLGMRNSLTLSAEEVEKLIADGNQYVVRFKIEPNEDVKVNDRIRGEVIINSSILDDKVLYKSADELPTYHLANIVDDHLMEVTHVIRGEEWLPSAPLHVLLYRAFGWESPEFAHLPLLLKPDGNGKLSKRDGDRLGFPVFPLEWKDPKTGDISSGYRESGYLPEAVINFLALLGWNPGNNQEIMSMEDLVNLFSLNHCSKSGAKFDYEKGKWFNHKYIQMKSNEEIIGKTDTEISGNKIGEEYRRTDSIAIKEGIYTYQDEDIVNKRVYQTTKSIISTYSGHKLLIGVKLDITSLNNTLQELKEEKEKALQADKLKSAFLANMSHEIRTPLNSIVGFSELLQHTDNEEDKQLFINIIKQNNEILLRLIGDILDLSKIESGYIDLKPEVFDLSPVVEDSVISQKQRVDNPKLTINLINPYKSCIVNLDKNRVIQILNNFISNAIKYTREGEITISYIYENQGISIRVKDTGIEIGRAHV